MAAVLDRVVQRIRRRAAQPAPVDLVAGSTAGQRWGHPGRCPDCGEPGYLDRVDLVDRELFQHCPACGCHWITTEAELEPEPQRG